MSEIESFLDPISGESPSGPNLRYQAEDSTFDLLKDLTTTVPGVDDDDEGRSADWSGAESLCYSALHEKTKDLELVCNLMEAWVRLEGLAGLEKGIDLMRGCIDRFWETLHPGIDPDDGELSLALRARWLNWMDNGKGFLLALKSAPLMPSPEGGSYTWRDYENTELLSDATVPAERRAELVEAGVISEAQWESALGNLSGGRLREFTDALNASLEQARALASLCKERFKGDEEDTPDLYNLMNVIEAMRDYFGGMASDEVPAAEGEALGEAAASGAANAGAAVGAIATRADALRVLGQVGDFFRRTEPHSPISYLIARAVKWGSMPLDALFKDVVKDSDVISHIWETLGIDASTTDDDD
jgi:type VI secretion system protein ImpA